MFYYYYFFLFAIRSWVRDKLLGLPSDDIDLAVDNLMGAQFARLVNEQLVMQGMPVRSIGVIQAQPDQSKHLETATFHVHDQAKLKIRMEEKAMKKKVEKKVETLGSFFFTFFFLPHLFPIFFFF